MARIRLIIVILRHPYGLIPVPLEFQCTRLHAPGAARKTTSWTCPRVPHGRNRRGAAPGCIICFVQRPSTNPNQSAHRSWQREGCRPESYSSSLQSRVQGILLCRGKYLLVLWSLLCSERHSVKRSGVTLNRTAIQSNLAVAEYFGLTAQLILPSSSVELIAFWTRYSESTEHRIGISTLKSIVHSISS